MRYVSAVLSPGPGCSVDCLDGADASAEWRKAQCCWGLLLDRVVGLFPLVQAGLDAQPSNGVLLPRCLAPAVSLGATWCWPVAFQGPTSAASRVRYDPEAI